MNVAFDLPWGRGTLVPHPVIFLFRAGEVEAWRRGNQGCRGHDSVQRVTNIYCVLSGMQHNKTKHQCF